MTFQSAADTAAGSPATPAPNTTTSVFTVSLMALAGIGAGGTSKLQILPVLFLFPGLFLSIIHFSLKDSSFLALNIWLCPDSPVKTTGLDISGVKHSILWPAVYQVFGSTGIVLIWLTILFLLCGKFFA
jgi:hypothetical protein